MYNVINESILNYFEICFCSSKNPKKGQMNQFINATFWIKNMFCNENNIIQQKWLCIMFLFIAKYHIYGNSKPCGYVKCIKISFFKHIFKMLFTVVASTQQLTKMVCACWRSRNLTCHSAIGLITWWWVMWAWCQALRKSSGVSSSELF